MKRKDETKEGRSARRALLSLVGIAGASWGLRALSAGARSPAGCVVRPQQTEGPFFVDTQLARSDVRSDPASGVAQPGIPLHLTFEVSRLHAGRCEPLPGAQVELWQCNAGGVYSGVRDRRFDTTGQRFLRGYQIADGAGAARFVTIYPGWYPGRTVHIHFSIRTGPSGVSRQEFTSQLYFDDALTDKVFTQPPYAERGPRQVRNPDDPIYRRGGSRLMLAVREQGAELAATFPIALEERQ